MPYADNGGIRIYYQTEGEGSPIVLQHWSLSTLEDWYEHGYVSALKTDYRLVLLDARGHGASDKSPNPDAYALKHRVADVVAVLDDLGIAQAHFFGYSMGGWIGFGIARYAPERFGSLSIGGQHPFAQRMDGLRQVVRYAIENGPEAFIAMWEKDFGPLSPERRKRMLAYDYRVLLATAQDRQSLESILPNMTMPCMLVVGERDSVYPAAKECAKQMPNVTFVTLPGLGHGEAIMRRDLVLPHIRRFLAAASQ